MGVAEFFSSLLVGVLSVFLSVSSGAERLIRHGIEYFGTGQIIEIDNSIEIPFVPPVTDPVTETDVEGLRVLPSLYEDQEYGGDIPHILITTPYRQHATVILGEAKTTPPSQSEATTTVLETKSSSTISDALVNIFCTMRSKNELRATTGSGVFISERGVILTNAHVAQFLLLDKRERGITTTCTVRAGNPATPKYYAKLLYIPPLWVNENSSELHSENPSGTGERDYALLYVTNAVTGSLPSRFPSLVPDVSPLRNQSKNQVVLAAGYPAEIIRSEGTKVGLSPMIATTTITELFTYTSKKVDLIGIAPSNVGEQGASGGPIVDMDGRVIGLIATRGNEEREGARSLRAITLAYIDRTIREETRVGLLETISGNLEARANGFHDIMTPILSSIVFDALTTDE